MARKRNTSAKQTKQSPKSAELDSVFFLKLVLYIVLGAQWLRLINPAGTQQIPIPVGLLIGLLFAMHEHFRVDRKIEYAILLGATFVGFWLPMGLIWAVLS